MKAPDDKRRRSPVDRFRRILSAEDEQQHTAESRKPAILNLPKAGTVREDRPAESSAVQGTTPAGERAVTAGRFLPIFWTVASILSMLANGILLVVVIALMRSTNTVNVAAAGPRMLEGLYTNFDRMDQAHIRTTIPVQSNIPLNLTVPVQTTTNITLARDASIPGAHVKINTPLFNIDAPASVTLPAGTSLEVGLDFDLPLQTEVPVSISVPVDIAVENTELHPAIIGLQDTIRPFYCLVAPAAVALNGQPVCR